MIKILLYGHTGWIGDKIKTLLLEYNQIKEQYDIVLSMSRIDNTEDVLKELKEVCPDRVIMAAGLTGRPNVDWCEDHKREMVTVNVLAIGLIAQHCYEMGIHLTYFGTGCIYEYNNEHPCPLPQEYLPMIKDDSSQYSDLKSKGYTEDDTPNFTRSYYSHTKIWIEGILKEFPNTLILRLRMPLTPDLHHRNFITKITSYKRIVNVPNSMTVLDDLLPISIDMMNKAITGIYNFCNPGVIDHGSILSLYQTYIDPSFKWVHFSLEEQAKILKAGRSNCHLDCSKLLKLYPDIPSIYDSTVRLFKKMSTLL